MLKFILFFMLFFISTYNFTMSDKKVDLIWNHLKKSKIESACALTETLSTETDNVHKKFNIDHYQLTLLQKITQQPLFKGKKLNYPFVNKTLEDKYCAYLNQIAKKLLSFPIPQDYFDHLGNTLLLIAMKSCSPLRELLIPTKLNDDSVNKANNQGETPLYALFINKHHFNTISIARKLFLAGADPNITVHGKTVLSHTLEQISMPLDQLKSFLELLIISGATVSEQDRKYDPYLHLQEIEKEIANKKRLRDIALWPERYQPKLS